MKVQANCGDNGTSDWTNPVSLTTDDKMLSLRVNYVLQGEKLVMQCRFSVNKTLFLPEEYDILRQIYDSIVEKNNEMVVLKKS